MQQAHRAKVLTRTRVAMVYAVAVSAGCLHEPVDASLRKGPRIAAPMPAGDGEHVVFTGTASYYANSLAGNRTANGDRYDPRALTAAHRSLPFGTLVRVTRIDTNDSVVVRINDRGPYAKRRVLDLSRAAARQLNMIDDGVVKVRAEVIGSDGERD